MAQLSMELVRVSTIVPAVQSQHHAHFLSNFDLRFDADNFYAQCVFIFRAGSIAKPSLAIQALKKSLSEVLVDFSVLAGRLRKNTAGRSEVDVNDQGIPFYEAVCSAKLDEQWPDLRDCASIDLKLNPENKPIANLQQVPLIRIQATAFACGGIALGFSALHMLVDGKNAIDFLKAWGERHRGVPIETPPQFCTWMLKARDPPVVNIPLDANFSFESSLQQAEVRSRNEDQSDLQRSRSPPLKVAIFRMDAGQVDRCVREVELGPFGYSRPTSYEAISALFWSSVTRARSPDVLPNPSPRTSYTVPMSVCRKGRFDPQLPNGYFGNSVVMALATSSVEAIAGKHFSLAAKLIHDKAKSYTMEMAKSVIDLVELRLQQGKSAAALSIGEGSSSGFDVLSTNFVAFPVYEIDFGWGKVDQMLFSFPMESGEGVISILPTRSGGRSREIAVCLRENQLKKLKNDAVLQNFCEIP